MKTIKSALFAALALLAFTSASNAASLNGLYIEAGGSAVGVELDGSVTDANTALGSSDKTVGQVGKTALTMSYGFGIMSSRASKFGFDAGVLFTPGEAKIKSSSTDSANSAITFEVSDSHEYYIAPMLNITEDASVYVKAGYNKADVNVTGDVTKINDMKGTTIAVGTVMSWGSNLYLRTEAGSTSYDGLNVTGLGTAGGVDTGVTASADPSVNYGKFAIGYKF